MPDETPAAAAAHDAGANPSLLGGDVVQVPAVTPSAPSYLVGADGAFSPNWRDNLPPEFKDNPALTTVPNLPELVKSYIHTKGMVGKRMEAPGLDATPEAIAAWRKTVGAPDTPEGYGELRPEDFPADQWDGETAGQLAQIAHKHHLPPAAVKEIIGLHAAQVKAGMEKFQTGEAEFKAAGVAALRKEWGADFDAQAHAAQTFAKAIGLNPANTPDFASPEFVLAMARGAKLIMGDKMITGAPVGVAGGIDSRIRDIQASPDYMGERGEQAQQAAQAQLHNLLNSRQTAA